MTDPTFPLQAHGGNLDEAARHFGIPVHGWLDLSTGINPRPYPVSAAFLDDTHWTRLPDAQALADLKATAAHYYGATPEAIVCAPGSQSLIGALARTTPQARVCVLEPTYSEHARAWADAGHDVTPVAAIDDAPTDATHLVLCNPNNPDGRLVAPERLLAEARLRHERGGSIVVDEAFADVAPDISVAPHTGTPGLIVLRSFGKFFGLAGVRLGFALGTPETMRTLESALGPWAVSAPALAVGRAALDDANWIADTRLHLAETRTALDGVLTDGGLDVLGGTDLFRLARAPGDDASALAARLGQAGILVRTFADHPGWVRFGLPATRADLDRLITALAP